MYVYYVCLLLLSEFNKCWREWSHTDNEIDENQKKTIAATKKYNYCDFLLLFAEWVNEEKQATRISKMYYTLFHWWKLTINFNVFDRRRHWVFLSFEQKQKKNCESTTRNRTYNKCTPTETTEVEMRKFEEKSKRLLYSNWSKSLAPSLWSAWSWKHNSQIVFSQKTMCRENVGAVRHNNMKW